MGKIFGQIGYVRGLITYSVSPYHQRTFAGFFKDGVPNMVRRFREQVFKVAPPLVAGYLIYDWAEREYLQQMRKVPSDYENDE